MTEPRSALVVDDERDIRELLVLTLGRMGLRVDTAATVTGAREMLSREKYALCLTDMRLPDGSGIDLVQEISTRHPNTPVAMITAFGNVEAAVEALKAGAFDFVAKPVDLTVLRDLVRHALMLGTHRAQIATSAGPRLQGDSPAMVTLRQTIAKVSRSQAPVYIVGESGVGKELTARSIHEQSARATAPFVPVNCGAIPTELMESEFFGHRKGSFTGAHADKPGLFQAAEGGTLFLDEVAELPLSMQVKLLRAIQEKSVRPVGAASEVPVDVRILSATHKNLEKLVDEGRFRHDLYYRINVIELQVPPLRERRDDLPGLAQSILQRLAIPHHRVPPTLSRSALDALNAYSFPGNVRELENILERAMAMADGDTIEAADLRLPARGAEPPPATSTSTPAAAPIQQPSLTDPRFDPRRLDPGDTAGSALPMYIEQMERAAIEKALQDHRYNKTKTAAALGITFRALRYKLKKLGID
ncbi:two-component system response regulator PilR (NtrC family) [Luteimonas cucumeris]|uniref:Two-component system response regulator PilR (NtrC family) n=1 Tax=Luteimonas cucumeris TaxID=985012 RepID=A0A562L5G5_9GAMM|nr:sigma-54 dependent transcriptional regulator [Luteimonas cucumeris]TWI02878.1 two-component system response regulator PilR (NtrC family) [Luteimonas cucumeris]